MSVTSLEESPLVREVESGSVDALVTRLNRWRDAMPAVATDGESRAYAVTIGGETIGGYLMTDIGPANEIRLIAINPEQRRRGYGRMCCMDALFRSGARPLVLNADEAAVGFARAVGFKIIGKRRLPDGNSTYRFGWHAPRPTTDPSHRPGC